MSNRVEELESKVAELQAAVNGLTEELVETKERLRQLEDGAETDYPVTGESPDADTADAAAESRDEGAKADEGVEDTEAESESESDESDIIVA